MFAEELQGLQGLLEDMSAEKLLQEDDLRAFKSGKTVDWQIIRTQVEEASAQLALGQTFTLNVLVDHFANQGNKPAQKMLEKCQNELFMSEVRKKLQFDDMVQIQNDFDHSFKGMTQKAKAKLLKNESENFIMKA